MITLNILFSVVFVARKNWHMRVIRKVSPKNLVCILKEERQYQTFLASKIDEFFLDRSMRQPMRDHCTTWECSHHCPHHLSTLLPNLPPCLGWAIVGSELIYCVSDLLNEVPKARIKFWKTPVQFANNSMIF